MVPSPPAYQWSSSDLWYCRQYIKIGKYVETNLTCLSHAQTPLHVRRKKPHLETAILDARSAKKCACNLMPANWPGLNWSSLIGFVTCCCYQTTCLYRRQLPCLSRACFSPMPPKTPAAATTTNVQTLEHWPPPTQSADPNPGQLICSLTTTKKNYNQQLTTCLLASFIMTSLVYPVLVYLNQID